MFEIVFNNTAKELNPTEFQYRYVDKAYSCSVVVSNREDVIFNPSLNPKPIFIGLGNQMFPRKLSRTNKEDENEDKREDGIKDSKRKWQVEVKKYKPKQHLKIISYQLKYKNSDPQEKKCLYYLFSSFAKSDFNHFHLHWDSSIKSLKSFSSFYESDSQFQQYFKNYFNKIKKTNQNQYSIGEFAHFADKNLKLDNDLSKFIFNNILSSIDTSDLKSILGYYNNSNFFSQQSFEIVNEYILNNKNNFLEKSNYKLFDYIEIVELSYRSKYYNELVRNVENELQKLILWARSESLNMDKSVELQSIQRLFYRTRWPSEEFKYNFLTDQKIVPEKYNIILKDHFSFYMQDQIKEKERITFYLKDQIKENKLCSKLEKILPVVTKNNPDYFLNLLGTPLYLKICGEEILTKHNVIPRYTRTYFKNHCIKNFEDLKCRSHFDYYWNERFSTCTSNNDCKKFQKQSILTNKSSFNDEEEIFNKHYLDKIYFGTGRTGTKSICNKNVCQADIDYCNTEKMLETFHSNLIDKIISKSCEEDNECKEIQFYYQATWNNIFKVVDITDRLRTFQLLAALSKSLESCNNKTPEHIIKVKKTIEKYNKNLKIKCENKKCKGYL